MTAEERRLLEDSTGEQSWKFWGPYLSERQWGTVREDASQDGNSWNDFTFEESHFRAYRWGEDGLAGLSDEKQRLCFALALWNEKDPYLKERLFGLSNGQGNHGEDVKEYYFYLDNTPTHSYQKFLYKYPQSAFPYRELYEVNARRTRHDFEYELLDTGVFDRDAYFDVFVEYAKASPHDILIEITVHNRGAEDAPLHLLPTLWLRNPQADATSPPEGSLSLGPRGAIVATHRELGEMQLLVEGSGAQALFTDNVTSRSGIYGKDAFHRFVVSRDTGAVNPRQRGSKAAYHVIWQVPAGKSQTLRLRLGRGKNGPNGSFSSFGSVLSQRRREADEFYDSRLFALKGQDERSVARQALAGMLWSKQFYHFDLERWLSEQPRTRNQGWFHMINEDIVSMPDKWEYPWYAAWDLAFHCLPLSVIDPDFAKRQMHLVLRETYMHPTGQLPAYEWNFSDVNPPVHAWATLFVYNFGKLRTGEADLEFLRPAFQKLLLNFTWWVNRKDRDGKNVFEGGFLGLDNIGVFDRSAPLPTGGHLEQADGTAWMALFCQNMFEMALEMVDDDESSGYRDLAVKFCRHFFYIAAAMNRMGVHEDEMWDEEDGFFYDLLRLPDGRCQRLKVRSMVGLLPMCAVSVIELDVLRRVPELGERLSKKIGRDSPLLANIADPTRPGERKSRLLSILNEPNLRRVLARLFDPDEFLSDYGIRSLSRYHARHPYVFHWRGQDHRVSYLPAESDTGMFGGNSNWRGPIWIPVNTLIVRALLQYYSYYGDSFKVEFPTGSGRQVTLYEAAREIVTRLTSIFLRNKAGKRPVYGGTEKFQNDPHWRDLILFYEYFHGDCGAGLGASHQTGWTGVVAALESYFSLATPETVLKKGSRMLAGSGKRK